MTNHSTKELKRQFEAARSRLSKAKEDTIQAEKRLAKALVDEANAEAARHGINIGDKIQIGSGTIVGFAGFDHWYADNVRAKVYKLKKDGTMGRQKITCGIWSVADLLRAKV